MELACLHLPSPPSLITSRDLKSTTITFIFKHLQMYIYFARFFCTVLHIITQFIGNIINTYFKKINPISINL